jgi:hypothetical protein
MSSQAEVVDALTAFYQQVIKHLALDGPELKISPDEGWTSIDAEALREDGKSEAVIDFLRHIPYLEPREDQYRLQIHDDTMALAYTQQARRYMEGIHWLPSECVYQTEGTGGAGYSLILDLEHGKILYDL